MGDPEERAVRLLHALRADRAPDELRANIERLRAAPRPTRPRPRAAAPPREAARAPAPPLEAARSAVRPRPRRLPWPARERPLRAPAMGLGAAVACAAVLTALVALTAGGPGASSVLQVAALGIRGPVIGAPVPAHEAPGLRLDRSVEDIYFPNWAGFGWRATGQRVDRLDGRLAVTVYYAWRSRSIAYTILASPPMREPSVASVHFAGTEFRTLHLGGRMVVTWRRLGHTCVLSGTGISARALYALAAWHPAGSDY